MDAVRMLDEIGIIDAVLRKDQPAAGAKACGDVARDLRHVAWGEIV